MRDLKFKPFVQLMLGIFLMLSSQLAFTQEDDCVIPYVFNVNNATCPGGDDGNATFSSPACPCMTSGCTFEWSNGETYHTATDLEAGFYTITVTHPDGCFVVDTVEVQEPPQMIVGVERVNPTCYGESTGSISLISSLNAGPLEYEWSNEISGPVAASLHSGYYEVTITNLAGCQEFKEFILEDPEMITVVSEIRNSCQGESNGEIAVEAFGANPPFEYLWNDPGNCTVPVLSHIAAGVYTVTVTDANDCQASLTKVVTEEELNVQAFAVENEICYGKTTQLVATGASEYLWTPSDGLDDPTRANPMASPAMTTTYTLLATDANGCQIERNVVVEVQEMVAPIINMGEQNICIGDMTFLSAFYVGGAASYEWSPTTGLTNPGTSNTNANPVETTTYTVRITDNDGCVSSGEVTVYVDDCSATPNESLSWELLSVYPNPGPGIFYLNGLGRVEVDYSVFDITGRELKRGIANASANTLDLTEYGAGIYYLQLATETHKVVKKLILQ